MAASYEWEVISEWDAKNPPSSFEDCDVHGEELYVPLPLLRVFSY
jgi:hypothetical protein